MLLLTLVIIIIIIIIIIIMKDSSSICCSGCAVSCFAKNSFDRRNLFRIFIKNLAWAFIFT